MRQLVDQPEQGGNLHPFPHVLRPGAQPDEAVIPIEDYGSKRTRENFSKTLRIMGTIWNERPPVSNMTKKLLGNEHYKV